MQGDGLTMGLELNINQISLWALSHQHKPSSKIWNMHLLLLPTMNWRMVQHVTLFSDAISTTRPQHLL